jgi:hypothetical protein
MAIISNAVTIADAGAFSVSLGAMTLIKTLTASSSANLTFVHGASSVVLDSTYPVYRFVCTNIHPATNDTFFTVNFRDGSTAYDATKTSTHFRAYQTEGGSDPVLGYYNGGDLAQGTGVQRIAGFGIPTDNDASCSGELLLFNPSSTAFVKHYMSDFNSMATGPYTLRNKVSGYCNVTAAIDGVQFTMSSGNIDAGVIKLYGIKDS